jgi:hypothetical protein
MVLIHWTAEDQAFSPRASVELERACLPVARSYELGALNYLPQVDSRRETGADFLAWAAEFLEVAQNYSEVVAPLLLEADYLA